MTESSSQVREKGAGERARELAAALIKEWREYATKDCPRNEKLSPHGQLAGIALVTGAQSVYTKCADELEAVLPVLAGALAAVRLETRQQMAMLAADECDGAQVERPSKTLDAAEFNRWITGVGDKIRALGGASDDWWEKSLAKARLEEARWRSNHWPPLGAVRTVESLQRWIHERVEENMQRIAALERAVEGK